MRDRVMVACVLIGVAALSGCGESPPVASSATAWSVRHYPVQDAAGGRAELTAGLDGSLVADWLATAQDSALNSGIATLSPSGSMASGEVLPGAPIDGPIASTERAGGAVASFGMSQTTAARGLRVRQLSRGGAPGQTTDLVPRSVEVGNAALASDPSGAAVLAWIEASGPQAAARAATLKVATRGADGAWSEPRALQRGRASFGVYTPNVAVATASNGTSYVVSQGLSSKGKGLVAWRLHQGQTSAPIAFAAQAYPNVLRAAITKTGTAIVAWSQQSVGSDVNSSLSVSATALPANSSRAARVVTIDRGTVVTRPRPGFELMASPQGGATLAWSQVDRSGSEIAVANANDAGVFQRRHQIIRGVSELGGLAIRADGTALLTAGHDVEQGPTQQVVAWTRPPMAPRFSKLDLVPVSRDGLTAPFDTSGGVDQGTVGQTPLSRIIPSPVFDPKTGDALVAFTVGRLESGRSAQLTVLRRRLK